MVLHNGMNFQKILRQLNQMQAKPRHRKNKKIDEDCLGLLKIDVKGGTSVMILEISMLNWSDHEGEDVENGAAQVYGMIAGAEDDDAGSATGDVAEMF
ncbi:hypothetical protein Tco_0836366 [Tanacetum coccineum]